MSTRAIIGIKNPDGTILGAWQWNDGDSILQKLNKNADTHKKAEELIMEGMWGSMFTAKEKTEFEDWYVNDLNKGRTDFEPNDYTEKFDLFLLKHKHHKNRAPEVYQDYEDMAGQDINHTYLFNPSTCKWVKDKDLVLMEEVKKTYSEEEIKVLVLNLGYMAQNGSTYTWQQLAEFLHYWGEPFVKDMMHYLKENGYISFTEKKKEITDLRILKSV